MEVGSNYWALDRGARTQKRFSRIGPENVDEWSCCFLSWGKELELWVRVELRI